MVDSGRAHTNIAFDHIKARRRRKRVSCCGDRTVDEFVPFYFCNRSPMLLTINSGNTGRPPGAQRSIVHLVTNVAIASGLPGPWAFSDGSAAAGFDVGFYNDLAQLDQLDWDAIAARNWKDRTHEKQAEFLVAGRVPWSAIRAIGCHNEEVAARVQAIVGNDDPPNVQVRPTWYYS
jgi:hypothetical protein